MNKMIYTRGKYMLQLLHVRGRTWLMWIVFKRQQLYHKTFVLVTS